MKNNLIDKLFYKVKWIKSSISFLLKTRKLNHKDELYMDAIEEYMASLDDEIKYHLENSSRTIVTEPKDFQNGFDHFLQMRDLIGWKLQYREYNKPIEIVKAMFIDED